MYKNILVAIDDSETSRCALAEAKHIAKTSQAKLYIAHVVDEVLLNMHGHAMLDMGSADSAVSNLRRAGQALLDNALKDAAGITLLPTVYLGVVLVAACLVPLVTIFLFKRRLVQIRLCAVELVLLIGAGAMMGIYFYLCNRYFADSEFYSHTLKISLVFPLVCLVFDLLALRAIFRDEKLVRSLDRIR